MNCTKCGTPIPEGSSFCLTCGTPAPQPVAAPAYDAYGNPVAPAAPAYDAYGNPVATAAPAYDAYGNPVAPAAAPMPTGYDAYGNPIYGAPVAPAAPAGPGPFANFMPALKGYFSKDLVKNVGAELKSNGLEWIIFGGASILMFAIAFIANIVCEMNKVGVMGISAASAVPVVPMFFALFFLGAVVYGLMSLGVFLVGNKFCKEKPSFLGALNLVGVATLPLTAIYTFNLIAGFISIWVCAVLSIIVLFLTAILIFAALDTNVEGSSFLGYAIVIASVIVLTIIFAYVIVMMMGSSASSSVNSSLYSSLY